MIDTAYFCRTVFKDDGQEVHRIARQYVAAKGPAAVEYLWDRAREAIGRGDGVSAYRWCNAAKEAERILAKA
jgi:hypothetical protein